MRSSSEDQADRRIAHLRLLGQHRTRRVTGDVPTNFRLATYAVQLNGQRFVRITGDPDNAEQVILLQNLLTDR